MKKDYEVKAEGWIDGTYRHVGDTLSLTEVEAQYLVMSGQIAEPTAKAEAAPAAKPLVQQPRRRGDGEPEKSQSDAG